MPHPRSTRLPGSASLQFTVGLRTAVAAAATAGMGLLAACSTIEAVPADRAQDPLCAQVAAAWPQTVGNRQRVETTADDQGVAAWGDPAIIARCGVTSPGPTTHECIDADGIDWVALPLDDGTRFVSYGRSPAVEVLVPSDYAPEGLVLPAFAEATAHIPPGERRCL